ncbi:prolargin [Sardina pilchardus]|uniref:prolargin n=1 Tax=Sardina pilchardus TaxID=27697 RepID=UPI002E150D72
MRAGFGSYSLLLLLLCPVLWGQRNPQRRPKKPVRPAVTRKPPAPVAPAAPEVLPMEPAEPTDFPPPILNPPSPYDNCPRECSCNPIYPHALYCENRNLRRVPQIPPDIYYLYLRNNYIDEVTADAFKNATDLKWVDLANNRVRRIDREVFKKVPNLLYLYMERNQMKEIPTDLPESLEQLRLSRNQISKIPAGAFNKLEHLVLLDLHHNRISDSNLGKNVFKDLKNLMQLNLAHNILRKMPSNVPSGIFQLFLDRNNIEDIPQDYFKDFTNLAFIRLNYNQLNDKGLPKMVFNISSLMDLHLAHNKLSVVPHFNGRLEHLHLNHNQIEYLNGTEICPHSARADLEDNEAVPRLRYLRLDGNHLSPPVPMDVITCFRHLHAIVI